MHEPHAPAGDEPAVERRRPLREALHRRARADGLGRVDADVAHALLAAGGAAHADRVAVHDPHDPRDAPARIARLRAAELLDARERPAAEHGERDGEDEQRRRAARRPPAARAGQTFAEASASS